jgi:hypothetical protein
VKRKLTKQVQFCLQYFVTLPTKKKRTYAAPKKARTTKAAQVGCGIGARALLRVLTVLLVRALRGGSPVPDETSLLVYAEEVPHTRLSMKKALESWLHELPH